MRIKGDEVVGWHEHGAASVPDRGANAGIDDHGSAAAGWRSVVTFGHAQPHGGLLKGRDRMARSAFSLSRLAGGPGAALPVLMYHRVLPERDPLQAEIHVASAMDTQFRTLARYFKVLPLDEAIALLAEGRLPARAVSISFDDGYRDNHDIALPLLQRHGLTATFYVSSGFLNGGTQGIFNQLIKCYVLLMCNFHVL